MKNINKYFIIILGLMLLACAKQGTPTGGKKDVLSPAVLMAKPQNLAINVPIDTKELKIYFNEFITLKETSKNIVISPPLKSTPTFPPTGTPKKNISIKINDSLQKNTTYSINFGQSIEDITEGNKLKNYTYVFSTGDVLDAGSVEGSVVDAENKTNERDVIVGLYNTSSYTDEIVTKEKPYYTTRLDANNKYKFENIKKGSYYLMAFNDKVPNLKFDPTEEKIAFYEKAIKVDQKQVIDNLRLSSPIPSYKAIDAKQDGYGKILFLFKGNPKTVNIVCANTPITGATIIHKPNSDSLSYYFNPNFNNIKDQKLKFLTEVEGKKDTLSLLYNAKKTTELVLKEINKTYTPSDTFSLESNIPIDNIDLKLIKIKADSVEIPFTTLINKTAKDNLVQLKFPIQYNKKYNINLKNKAITDIFGNNNLEKNITFQTKTENDYGSLNVNLTNTPKQKFWIELYDKNDQKIKFYYNNTSTYTFKDLIPGEYYLKLLVDENEDGIWGHGRLKNLKQPEKMYLSAKNIIIRSFWEVNETWDLP